MNKTIILIVAVILTLLVVISGCEKSQKYEMPEGKQEPVSSENRKDNDFYSIFGKRINPAGSMKDYLDRRDDPSFSGLNHYDMYKFYNSSMGFQTGASFSNFIIYLDDLLFRYEAEYVVQTDEDHIYIVIDISNEKENVFAFVFFEREIIESEDGTLMEEWKAVRDSDCSLFFDCYYYTKKLSMSDLGSLKTGDSFKDLKKIDETFCFGYHNLDNDPKNGERTIVFKRVLTDGTAIIKYSLTSEEIVEITLVPYGETVFGEIVPELP